jgi:hypothetical protein
MRLVQACKPCTSRPCSRPPGHGAWSRWQSAPQLQVRHPRAQPVCVPVRCATPTSQAVPGTLQWPPRPLCIRRGGRAAAQHPPAPGLEQARHTRTPPLWRCGLVEPANGRCHLVETGAALGRQAPATGSRLRPTRNTFFAMKCIRGYRMWSQLWLTPSSSWLHGLGGSPHTKVEPHRAVNKAPRLADKSNA